MQVVILPAGLGWTPVDLQTGRQGQLTIKMPKPGASLGAQ